MARLPEVLCSPVKLLHTIDAADVLPTNQAEQNSKNDGSAAAVAEKERRGVSFEHYSRPRIKLFLFCIGCHVCVVFRGRCAGLIVCTARIDRNETIRPSKSLAVYRTRQRDQTSAG
jgi:hypothetical protein